MKKLISFLTVCSVLSVSLLSGCSFNFGFGDSGSSSAAPTESTTAAQTTAAASSSVESGKLSPMIWQLKGEKGNNIYFFGTIHVGDERNQQVVEQLADKLSASDYIAVECDTVAFQEDFSAMMDYTQSMLYADGTRITDHMDKELYDKSVDYLTENNAYNELYDMYNMSFWFSLLEQTAVAKSSLSAENAVDTQLINYANDNDKTILEVESVQFQADMLNSFSDELYNLMIESFLMSAPEYSESMNEMYSVWLEGNQEKLTELTYSETDGAELTAEQQKLYDQYTKAMFTDRNKGMAQKAEQYLEDGKNVFFAVGAGHFIGDTGIVKLLTDKGYELERIEI